MTRPQTETGHTSAPSRRTAFRIHVGCFFAGPATVALGFGNGWLWAVALGGVLVAASGVAAIVARRSLLMSQPLRALSDAAHDEGRAQTERANAWMSGIVLTAFGVVVAVLGATAWLGG